MKTVIEQELSVGDRQRAILQGWVDDPDAVNSEQLVKVIERIGKGRFAQVLAPYVSDQVCPAYIQEALELIRNAVS